MNDLLIPVLLILLAPLIGGLVYGFERIIKARMQRRIGPPLLQPFYDFLKLADKRKMIVHSAHAFLGIMHFVSLWFALAVLLLGGDLILVIFLHLLSTSLIIILCSFAIERIFFIDPSLSPDFIYKQSIVRSLFSASITGFLPDIFICFSSFRLKFFMLSG